MAVVVWHAVARVHVEAVERVVDDLDFAQVFDPVRAKVARHHEFEWVTVEKRQVFPVHAPGNDRIAVHGQIDVECFYVPRCSR
ncbi:hypothetical protein D3C84_866430 [compost metagenome]